MIKPTSDSGRFFLGEKIITFIFMEKVKSKPAIELSQEEKMRQFNNQLQWLTNAIYLLDKATKIRIVKSARDKFEDDLKLIEKMYAILSDSENIPAAATTYQQFVSPTGQFWNLKKYISSLGGEINKLKIRIQSGKESQKTE